MATAARRISISCFGAARSPKTSCSDHREIRRLRSRLFAFINSKQQPKNYTLMIRYLLHWQVSVYSLVWTDVLLWIGLYTVVNVMYRHALNGSQQDTFVRLVHSVGVWQSNVPVTFLLGFYVSTVVDRWWSAYMAIPTIGSKCLCVEAAVYSKDNPQKAEEIRIVITRYLNLAWLLYMWKVSEKVKQRFRILRSLISEANRVSAKVRQAGSGGPNSKDSSGHLETSNNFDMFHFRVDRSRRLYPALQRIQSVHEDVKQHQVDMLVQDLVLLNQDPVIQENYGEIITPSEIAVFEERARNAKSTYSIEYELPLHWAVAVAQRALLEGFLATQDSYENIVRVCSEWAAKLGTINKFANKNLPLVYTQVVIIAVYTWFFIEVVSAQNLMEEHVRNMTGGEKPTQYSMQYWTDFYVPIFALVKLLFVLGWFKVAFILMDPFGDDTDDLPLSDILNSNLRKGRVLGGFSPDLFPRKLRRSATVATSTSAQPDEADEDYLHSDEELIQELINEQAGPWLQPVEEKAGESASSSSRETSFHVESGDTPSPQPSPEESPRRQPELRPLLQHDIP